MLESGYDCRDTLIAGLRNYLGNREPTVRPFGVLSDSSGHRVHDNNLEVPQAHESRA